MGNAHRINSACVCRQRFVTDVTSDGIISHNQPSRPRRSSPTDRFELALVVAARGEGNHPRRQVGIGRGAALTHRLPQPALDEVAYARRLLAPMKGERALLDFLVRD